MSYANDSCKAEIDAQGEITTGEEIIQTLVLFFRGGGESGFEFDINFDANWNFPTI
jgi:hypothetical protein